MPVRQHQLRAESATADDLGEMRLVLAKRLASVWRNDSKGSIADEVRAWLQWATDSRDEHRERNRRFSEWMRIVVRRRFKAPAEALGIPAEIPDVASTSALIGAAVNRVEHSSADRWLFNVMWLAATMLGNAEQQPLLARKARRALRHAVDRAPYIETAEIAWVLGSGKTNAPQTIVALALAELGWSTAQIATTIPAAGRTDGRTDKAQVRRMTRTR